MVLELTDLIRVVHGASNVILDASRLLILGQLVHKSLVATILGRHAFGTNNEDMLHVQPPIHPNHCSSMAMSLSQYKRHTKQ